MNEYFSHDYNTTQNAKIVCLLGDYGGLGYGMYWRIIELLHQNKEHRLPIKPYIIEAIAKQMLTSAEEVKRFISDCCEKYELFDTDDVMFWSDRVFDNISYREHISGVRSIAGKAGAIAKQNLANASKGNERKGNEKKLKNNIIQPSATASGVVTVSERPIQPHQTVVEDMKKLYEEKTGQPFAYKKEYFILTAALIKQHGIDAVNEKCRILAICCENGEAWFAKDGWASFNPKKLSAHWNELIPQKKYLSKEERDAIESQEIRKKLKEQDDECAAIVAEAKRQRKAQAGAPVQVTG